MLARLRLIEDWEIKLIKVSSQEEYKRRFMPETFFFVADSIEMKAYSEVKNIASLTASAMC